MPFDPTDKAKLLYDAVSKDYDLGTYDEFQTKLKDPTKRKAFFDGIGHEYDLGDYNTFNQKLGYDSEEVKQQSQPQQSVTGIPMADIGQIQSIISKKNQELSNQPIQEEGQAIYSQMAKRDNAIHNTIERNNQSKPVDKTSPEYQQQFDNLLSQEKNHDVKVVDAKDGKPFVVPTSGFWENAGKSFVQSLKAPVEAIKQIGMDNKELSDYFENKKKNEPYLPESVPSPVGGLGQTLGGLPKTVVELAIPVVGEALAATETELSSTGQQTEALYNRRLQELKDAKGDQNYEPTPQEKEQIAGKARLDAPLAAAPDAAMILVLNKMGGDAPALNKSAETFSQSLSKYGEGVGKLAALGGTSEGVRSGIMALQGYHVTPQEALDKSVEGATTWGLMDAMFKVAPLVSKLPKAAQAAWKDYMTHVPKPVFEEKVSQMGEEGQQIKEDVSKFDEAKNIVHPKEEEVADNEEEQLDAFMKRKGMTIEDYRNMNDDQRDKIGEEWVNSNEYKSITNNNEQKNPTTAEPINTTTEEEPKEEPQAEVIQQQAVEGNQPSNEPQPSEEIGVAETKPIEPAQEPNKAVVPYKEQPLDKPVEIKPPIKVSEVKGEYIPPFYGFDKPEDVLNLKRGDKVIVENNGRYYVAPLEQDAHISSDKTVGETDSRGKPTKVHIIPRVRIAGLSKRMSEIFPLQNLPEEEASKYQSQPTETKPIEAPKKQEDVGENIQGEYFYIKYVDLKGGKKEDWMKTKDEYKEGVKKGIESERTLLIGTKGDHTKTTFEQALKDKKISKEFYDKNRYGGLTKKQQTQMYLSAADVNHPFGVKQAIKENKYQKAISEGRMTADDAKKIIESAGLEVPKDILGKSNKEQGVQESDTTKKPQGTESQAPKKEQQKPEKQKDNSVVGETENKKQLSNKEAFKQNHGVDFDEFDKTVEKLKDDKSRYGNPIEKALLEHGIVKGNEVAERNPAYSDYVKIKLEEPLPKKLPTNKEKIDVAYADDFKGNINIQPLEQKVKPVEKSDKGSIASISKNTSKDDLRPAMTGVYLDAENKAMVATDAHKLVWIDTPNIKESKIINPKTGATIDAKFPDYKVVIPEDNPIKVKGLSIGDLLNQTNGIDRANKFISGKELVAVIKIGDTNYAFDPKLLNDVLTTFAEHGAKKIDFDLSKPTRAMIFSSKETPKVHGLLMPKMFYEEEGSSQAHKLIYERESTKEEKQNVIQADIDSLNKDLKSSKKKVSDATAMLRKAKSNREMGSAELDIEYHKERVAELEKQIEQRESDLKILDNPLQEEQDLQTVKENISDGSITSKAATDFIKATNEQSEKIEPIIKDIESKAESDNEVDLNEAIQKADELISQPINTETNAITDNEVKKTTDLGNKARDYAKKLRSGDANVLPDWLRANLPEGTKKSGISINEAFAKALETFADIHDATKDFAKAVEEGFKHIKDWFDENKIPYNEQELKQKFADDRKAESVGDNETTSIKNATTQLRREQYGLNEEIPAAKKEFGATWDEAKKKIESGYDPQDLVDELAKNPRPVTDTENAILLHHQNTNEIKLENLNNKINEAAESGDEAAKAEYKAAKASVLDRLQKLYDVNKRVGTENARGLASRKMMVDRKYSLANMVAEKRASSNDGKPLSDEQQKEVEELHKKIKETQKAYDDYVTQAEGEIKDLQEKILGKKVANKKTAAQKLRDFADKIEKSKFGKADLGDGTQIQGVSIDVNKFVADAIRLIADGLDKGEEVLDLIKDAVEKIKATNPNVDEKALNKAINKAVIDADIIKAPSKDDQLIKKYSGILSGSGVDRKGLALRADAERAKNEFDITIKQDEQKNRSLLQKGQDIFVKWQRGFKLSNPLTLGKLTMAGMTRLVTTPLEDVVGGFYSTVLPQLAKGAIGEGGGLNVNETAKAYKNGLVQGIKDAGDILRKGKHGKSNLDVVFGSPADLPPEAIDFFGQLHSAIKAPIKRFAFERGLERRLRRNIANGVDVSDPMVQTEILTGAYKDANRAIFMQDNKVATGYQKMVEYLSKADPKTGKAPSKPVATALQWMLPFVKVPTNIASEIGAHVYGLEVGAGKIITNAFTKGLDNLSGDEKDIILRNLKKGSLGTAALVLGYMNPQIFGGYYQPKEKRSEEDAKAGGIKLFGMNIPAWFIEAPIYQTMQIGATIRRVKDTKVKDANGKVEEKGIGEGILAGALGLADHVPMIDQPVRMASLFTDPKERDWYVGELAKSTVDPALLSYIASATDPADKESSALNPQNKRSPKTMAEHIKSGIPGLREQVPLKSSVKLSEEGKKDPTLKFFMDKSGGNLPNVELKNQTYIDATTKHTHSISEAPKEKQDQYTKVHEAELLNGLKAIKSRNYVYTNGVTDVNGNKQISITYKKGKNLKRIPLGKLNEAEYQKIESLVQKSASTKAKQSVFKDYSDKDNEEENKN
jgi:hypothetical protein